MGDGAGNLYVSTLKSLLKITPTGQITQLVGAPLQAAACFARDAAGNFYVAEDFPVRLIRKISANGTVTTLAGNGLAGFRDGPAGVGRISAPHSMVLASDGYLYLADRSTIRQIDPQSGYIRTIAGDTATDGYLDGQGRQTRFNGMCSLSLAPGGNLYVSDYQNHCLRTVTPAGAVTTLAGSPTAAGYADGVGAAVRFGLLGAVTSTPNGDALVVEAGPNRIRRITPAGVVSTYLDSASTFGQVDGPAAQARFTRPVLMTNGTGGNILLYESNQSRNFVTNGITGGKIRQVSSTGTVTTLFTISNQLGYRDGPVASAKFGQDIQGMVQDANGNVYLTDSFNKAIRKISTAGIVSTVAGGDTTQLPYQMTYQDGVGRQAYFGEPGRLAIDATGNLYMYDYYFYNIRKITPAGVVSTVAGYAGGSSGPSRGIIDGQGAAAGFGLVASMAATADGTLYLADYNTVRKVSPAGLVTTVAGDPTDLHGGEVDGSGSAARFNFGGGLVALAVSPNGVAFVSEWNTGFNTLISQQTRIRQVTPDGRVSTVVGSNETGFVNGPALTAVFGNITGLAFTPAGNLVIADGENFCLRQLSGVSLLATHSPATASAGQLLVYPNPAVGGYCTAILPATIVGQPVTLTLVDMLGRPVWQHIYTSAPAAVDLQPVTNLPAGLYYLRCISATAINSSAILVP
ncbi:T9SS type A sorting domain-containing protein [Hymenobacter sp. BRD67]|uniref:T9SS type A sorting domain-containing protein n=1 Tax=Hymenobacter sp. BRD67 TaxID=2675877 RepID=UPI001564FB2D|nr:T9SS type A sorting domain-containing protein [Hymenobacter sp. BRD67]QKG53656.1 T9SS type A sorting domain-containing protein [Hymenobacter sp. BRD67]